MNDTPPAALRLAVVGPTHPYKGGVAAHTTTLCHELAGAGHEVTLVSWSRLYPAFLYPGEQAVPGGAPEVEPFARTVRSLSWSRPDSWVRTGRRLRGLDALIVVHVIPPAVPAHLGLLRAAGVGRTSSSRLGPRSIVVAHNVLPHESRPGDAPLVESLLRRVDSVVVHSDEQVELAYSLGADHVRQFGLPPHLPGGPPREHLDSDGPTRLLALGMVRDYKGTDLLLEAMREVPDISLTVAGELWGESGRLVKELAADPVLRERVQVYGGYVPADRIAELLAQHDVLALPYRHATASQNVLLAQRHGLPVLASEVGTFASQVRDGVDGLLVPPGNRARLVEALQRLGDPGYAAKLRAQVRRPDLQGPWTSYITGLEATIRAELSDLAEPESPQPMRPPPRWSGVSDALRAARLARRRKRSLTPAMLPEWVRSTDVLVTDEEALRARSLARQIGLPRTGDPVAAWAALGALAAIVRVRDDGRQQSVIVDESGMRSPLSRWARSVGFEPVELDLTGPRSSIQALDVDTASLDVLTRLHPCGPHADDIDHTIAQASWVLRAGGLLIVTLPIGDDTPQWAVTPADLRAIVARASDRGLDLIEDLDQEIVQRLRAVSLSARERRENEPRTHRAAAYGIVRLTFRRR